VARLGVEGLHFHDLRHIGNHLAAQTGDSLRDLMLRMAHDSMRAAVIHQHASDTGDRRIADALDAVIGAATEGPVDDQTGDQDAARQSHAGSERR
jgi:integrase